MTDLERALAKAGITDGDMIADMVKSHSSAEVSDSDILDEAASLIVKAMEVEMEEEDDEDEEMEEKGYGSYKKADEDDEDEDEEMEKSDYDLVAIVSKGADMVLDSVERQNGALTKGFFAIRDAHTDLRKSVNGNSSRLNAIEDKIDSLIKALGQPVAPRGRLSADDVDAVEPMAKGGVNTGSLIAKAKSRIAESTDANEQRRLAMAVAELDSGMNPETVAARYGIV